MAKNKNGKRKNDQGAFKGPLKRLARIGGKALLQGVCRSIGYHLGTAAIICWWLLLSS
jgi:hypothetical protein